VRGCLRLSFKDGIFASIMTGVTDNYVIPFSLILGATVQQVGWISGLPNLFGSLSQFLAVRLIYRVGGRLRLLVRTVMLQATVLVLISGLSWIDFSYRIESFLILLVLFSVSGALAGPAWGSLMTEYIPMNKRGHYFGWRSRIMGGVNMLSMVLAGFVLYGAGDASSLSGFFIIFLAGSLSRFISGSYLARMQEVIPKKDPASDFTFVMFLARFRESNFVRFVAFVASLTFSAYLAGPFFVVFMLRDLEFSYLTYTLLQLIATLAGLIALPLWGRHADLIGNVRVLRLAGFMTTLIPALWLISHHVLYLAFVQILAGFAWSGVNLCANNFIYDAVTPKKRVRCISYFNAINGSALFLGATLGGYLASRLPPVQGYPLLSLFALSFVTRIVFFAILSGRFSEVRPSREVSIQELFFSVVGIRPLIRISRD
jgi:MFS family permease